MRDPGRGPDHVVAGQREVDQGAQRGRVTERRDPADRLPGRGPDELRVARDSVPIPSSAATRAVSTRWAPLVSTSSGVPSASNTSELAIAPTATPSCAAASAAVRAAAASSTTSPAAASASVTFRTPGCSAAFVTGQL